MDETAIFLNYKLTMYSLAAIVPFYNEERFLEESVTKLSKQIYLMK